MMNEMFDIKPKIKKIGAYNPEGIFVLFRKGRPAMWDVFYKDELAASFVIWQEAIEYAEKLKLEKDRLLMKKIEDAYAVMNQVRGF